VTGVAVVDDTGKLKGNLSLRDLKAMSTDGRFFWRLYQTVDNYLTKLKKEVKGKLVPLLLEWSWSYTPSFDYRLEGQRPKRVQSCKASDTLEHAINLLADHSIHRVYVVDDAKKPIGVVTLKDVLCEILAP